MRLLLLLLLAAPAALADSPARPDTLLTTAEASDFRATSRYADVVDFLKEVAASPRIHLTTFGETHEGRALPLAVVGARDASANAVKAEGKLRVFVMANIHAGEVAGKEAALMLLREIAGGRHAAWADSLVLLVAPIYNADGNERIGPANRPYQHGPVDGMGQRPNAQGLDLNRDFVKLDAPESRALVGLMNTYDPHVVVDLHTTNGTVHGYGLTYAGPLHPNTPLGIDLYLRGEWLPAVRQVVRERTGEETFYYGNDKPEWGQPRGWATFDPRPRFGTNYAGLRNRFGILSEAYSYATFEDRVRVTLAFVTALLDYAHAHAAEIAEAVERADLRSVVGEQLAARSAGSWQASCAPGEVLLGEVVEEPNPHTGRPMWRRTDARRTVETTMYQRFGGSDGVAAPLAYLVPPDQAEVLDRLRAHGVQTRQVLRPQEVEVEAFRVDSVRVAEREFQGRYERELFGRYERDVVTLEPGTVVVPVGQPLGRLAFSLLEPRSDGGLANWGLVEAEAGAAYPIRRVPAGAAFLLPPTR